MANRAVIERLEKLEADTQYAVGAFDALAELLAVMARHQGLDISKAASLRSGERAMTLKEARERMQMLREVKPADLRCHLALELQKDISVFHARYKFRRF